VGETYKAVVKCHDKPQKKKKKNTTHLKLFTRAFPNEFVFNRYWNIADEIFDNPEKITIPSFQTVQDEHTGKEDLP
jgi:hypothetical protein